MTETPKLKLFTAISVVIGCVIGSGVFVKPAKVLVATGSSNLSILAWILGGLISLAGGLTMAETAARIPKTGGVYLYVEELFGKSWGFVCGWIQAVIYAPALTSALSLYFATLLAAFFGLEDGTIKPVAILSLFGLSLATCISTNLGAGLQNLTTFIKLIPIGVIGIVGLFKGEAQIFNSTLSSVAEPAGMGVAVLATLWAYDGWAQVANMGGEIENPSKNLPRAFIFGIIVVMGSYLMVNIALFHILPVDQMATLGEKTASVASELLLGGWAGKALSLGIMISIFGALNGNILTMSRVAYAMAERKSFPFAAFFGQLHPRTKTPVNSTIMKAFLALIMILLLNSDRITDIAMFIVYLSYTAVYLGVYLQRKRIGPPPAGVYRVPLYPVMPALACMGSLYVCYSMARGAPMDAAVSLFVALSGLPIYNFMNKNR